MTLPNLQLFTITRASIQAACEMGITANQIIGYIKNHVHEKQKNSSQPGLGGTGIKHILPPVVTDSIRLWAEERNRLKIQDVALYESFESNEEYLYIKSAAQKYILWVDDSKKTLVCSSNGHALIKKKYKEFKNL